MPRGAKYVKGSGYQSRLPSARKVSSEILQSKNVSDPTHTHALMQFGQLLDHDMSWSGKAEHSCCGPDLRYRYLCFNIDLSGDKFYSNFSRDCMDFTRSFTHCGSSTKWLEQINGATAFLDASFVSMTWHSCEYSSQK